MKKLILSLFLSIIWFIGFTSAWTLTNCSTSVTDNWDGDYSFNYNWCSPSYISLSSLPFDEDWMLDITVISNLSNAWVCYFDEDELPEGASVSSESCSLRIWFYACNEGYEDEEWNYVPCENTDEVYLTESESDYTVGLDREYYPNWVYVHIENADFGKDYYLEDWETLENITYLPNLSATLTFEWTVEPDEPDEPDEPWTWWNENPPVIPDNPSEWWNWWNIVPDWSLVAVIVWVFSVFWELIPYVVYIWIWILLVTIWFYAIRRLVNWLSDKIHNNFNF